MSLLRRIESARPGTEQNLPVAVAVMLGKQRGHAPGG